MKKILIGLTLLGSMSSFAAENAIRLEDRIDEIYPTEEVTYIDLYVSGKYFLALTSAESHAGDFESAKERADSICRFLEHPKGALSYEIHTPLRGHETVAKYHTINDGQLVTKRYESEYSSRRTQPKRFESINCKL